MISQLFAGGTYDAVKHLLDLATQRQEALAGNIANVETPGYHRVDLEQTAVGSFQTALRAAADSGDFSSMAAAANQSVRTVVDPTAQGTRADGNNVEIDRELGAMSQNTVEYGALSEFAGSSLRCLRMAISGNVT